MDYRYSATTRTPAHIIYVLDASGSMEANMPGTQKRKIDYISDVLEEVAYQIYLRARRGTAVADRYRLAIFAYGNAVIDLTGGDYVSIKEFLQGIPEFGDLKKSPTNTVEAMRRTLQLLKKTIAKIGLDYPPPIVCHLTDGEYTKEYGNPSSVMKEIMNLETHDGKVLLENIYLGDKLLAKPISDTEKWSGISDVNELSDPYAEFLYNHSSLWPERYITDFNNEHGLNLKSGTRMFFPAEDINTIKLAFTASTATPRGHAEELK